MQVVARCSNLELIKKELASALRTEELEMQREELVWLLFRASERDIAKIF